MLALGDARVSLAAFLDYCRDRRRTHLPSLPAGIDPGHLADRFIAAGADDVEQCCRNDGWAQVGVALSGRASPELYARIRALFIDALNSGQARNAFFMHKPPGLRLRLQAPGVDPRGCAGLMSDAAEGWRAEGLIAGFAPEVYEPETTLFGGDRSMAHVHRLFTADSAFWLDLLGRGAGEFTLLAVSLVALRKAFATMEIVDWEDLDVWHKVRAGTGRSFRDRSALGAEGFGEIAAEIVRLWSHPDELSDRLGDAERAALDALGRAYETIIPDWRRTCFDPATCRRSPRAAAALYTIFFWNRGAISFERQQILAEALAGRPVPDGEQ